VTKTCIAVSTACDGYRRRVTLRPRDRERVLDELVNLRPRRDRLAAAFAGENVDCVYRDSDAVHPNDRITELTCVPKGGDARIRSYRRDITENHCWRGIPETICSSTSKACIRILRFSRTASFPQEGS
jgi:hypothetical protein